MVHSVLERTAAAERSLALTADDFAWATRRLIDAAGETCGYKVVSLLEGGYDLKGLSLSVAAHVGRLMSG